MKRHALDIPQHAAREFVADMEAFFAAPDRLKGDEIAADAAWKLKQHLPKGTKLRLTDVKALFLKMRDQV